MAGPDYTGYSFPGLENLRNDIYPAISASKTPSLSQSGKVVLITGAGRGIGRAIALQYAHASVATIILAARTGSQLDEVESSIQKINSNIKVLKFQLNVTSDEAVQKCAQEVQQKVGRLDVLVNNAGTSDDWVPLIDAKTSEWWNTFEVNLKGPFLLTHAFINLLRATAKEHNTTVDVLNVSSIGAHVVMSGASAYQISKLSVVRLTEFIDAEYKDDGVNAISLHPGGVVTELSKDVEQLKGRLNDTPDLCGGFVVWLTATPRKWLAGRYVSATWDVEKLESMKEEIIKGDKLKVKLVV